MLSHKHEDVSNSQKYDCSHTVSNSFEVDKPGEDFLSALHKLFTIVIEAEGKCYITNGSATIKIG